MERAIMYPNYINYYYYEEGDDFIILKRFRGTELIYFRHMEFDTPEEAMKYFEENCGA